MIHLTEGQAEELLRRHRSFEEYLGFVIREQKALLFSKNSHSQPSEQTVAKVAVQHGVPAGELSRHVQQDRSTVKHATRKGDIVSPNCVKPYGDECGYCMVCKNYQKSLSQPSMQAPEMNSTDIVVGQASTVEAVGAATESVALQSLKLKTEPIPSASLAGSSGEKRNTEACEPCSVSPEKQYSTLGAEGFFSSSQRESPVTAAAETPCFCVSRVNPSAFCDESCSCECHSDNGNYPHVSEVKK